MRVLQSKNNILKYRFFSVKELNETLSYAEYLSIQSEFKYLGEFND